MVIRQIRQHATTHNWFAVVVDLAVVGIGVFIGIEAANWNQRGSTGPRLQNIAR